MNIYALKGYKVSVTDESAKVGDEHDKELVKKHLRIGKIYTVNHTKVHRSYTNVHLNEVDGIIFNSVSFVDAEKQSKNDDKKHPDWNTWETEEGYEAYLKDQC